VPGNPLASMVGGDFFAILIFFGFENNTAIPLLP
jgi:hypothetical protein